MDIETRKSSWWIIALAATCLSLPSPAYTAPVGSCPDQSSVAARTTFSTIDISDPLVKSALAASDIAAAAKLIGRTGAFIGTVSSVYSPPVHDIVILDFDAHYRNALTAVAKPQSYSKLPPLSNLIRTRVVVTGVFVDYDGTPQINITESAQIRIVVGEPSDSPMLVIEAPTSNRDNAAAAKAGAAQPPGTPPQPDTEQPAPTSSPVLNIPGGLTVVAASDQASVDWLPIPGARSYDLWRNQGGSNFIRVAQGTSELTYLDHGLKSALLYTYLLTGYSGGGTAIGSETADVTPDSGSVVVTDPLTDWSLAVNHSDNLSLDTNRSGVPGAKRTTPDVGSIMYNLPGLASLLFDVIYIGSFDGQVTLEASPDSFAWAPVDMAHTPPASAGAGYLVSVCSPVNPLPKGTNYVRMTLLGAESADTPIVGAIRAAYGATFRVHPIVPSVDATPVSPTTHIQNSP
ncbi:MAG: hypothetical protein ACLQVD_20945 [Capsulimonadaceae bacterium]